MFSNYYFHSVKARNLIVCLYVLSGSLDYQEAELTNPLPHSVLILFFYGSIHTIQTLHFLCFAEHCRKAND